MGKYEPTRVTDWIIELYGDPAIEAFRIWDSENWDGDFQRFRAWVPSIALKTSDGVWKSPKDYTPAEREAYIRNYARYAFGLDYEDRGFSSEEEALKAWDEDDITPAYLRPTAGEVEEKKQAEEKQEREEEERQKREEEKERQRKEKEEKQKEEEEKRAEEKKQKEEEKQQKEEDIAEESGTQKKVKEKRKSKKELEQEAAREALKSEIREAMSGTSSTALPPAKPIMLSKRDSSQNTPESALESDSKFIDYNVTLENEGWYYDTQLSNELQSISLHANQKYTPTENSMGAEELLKNGRSYDDWGPWIDEPCDDDVYETNYEGVVGCGYRIEPICKSLFYEDFVVNAENSWSDLGSDMIGSLWDSFRATAPFSDFLSHALGDMSTELKGRGYDSKFANGMANILSNLSTAENKMSVYQNKALVVTGTQMSLFGGTGLGFNNLGLRLTLFPEIKAGPFGSTAYKTVTEQVEELYPYLIGIYKKDTTLNDLANSAVEKVTGEPTNTYDISSYIGWNNPPGGYRANNHLLDTIHQGTLKLRIGGQYSIPNLVCQSASFSFSKQMVKLPKTIKNSTTGASTEVIETSPLYCDLQIVLRPMSRYTNRILNDYIAARKKDGNLSVRKQQLDTKINENLQNLKKRESGR